MGLHPPPATRPAVVSIDGLGQSVLLVVEPSPWSSLSGLACADVDIQILPPGCVVSNHLDVAAPAGIAARPSPRVRRVIPSLPTWATVTATRRQCEADSRLLEQVVQSRLVLTPNEKVHPILVSLEFCRDLASVLSAQTEAPGPSITMVAKVVGH